ncbi:Peptide chain release factor 1 (eRF1), partial [Pseudoloma neurophilia]
HPPSLMDSTEDDNDLRSFKLKRQLIFLRDSRGNGTSMISLILPPNESISKTMNMLVNEYGTASNIKSRVNRLSVLSAITSAQQKLKTFSRVPENGLAIFVGNIIENNKEKKISLAIEPIKPINTSLYLCDSKFHIESLLEQFKDNEIFGFIIMDGTNTLFATLNSNIKNIIYQMSVSLPKKHGRGGQSSVRFARLRVEKRNAYVKKVAEEANRLFPKCEGFIFAGTADFKNNLYEHASLDKFIKSKVIKIVDTNYGGENGLNQSIELSQDALLNCKYVKEREILQNYFQQLENDMVTYSIKNVIRLLQDGSLSRIIVLDCIDTLNIYDFIIIEDEEKIKIDKSNVIDWLLENYKKYNTELMIISDKSTESSQFKEGFNGIGGILKYKIFENEEIEEVASDEIF